MNAWNTGFTTSVTVKNNGSAVITGWALAFTLPSGQSITGAGNATIAPSSGAVTARNMSYNGTIAAGGSQNFGFQATHNGNTAKPTGFTLNGSPCSS